MNAKLLQRKRRHIRIVRKMVPGKPRLVVYRSLKHIYAQIIDDQLRKTIVSASDMKMNKEQKTKKMLAREVGKEIAQKALAKNIKTITFDRAGYRYHGRVKELAEGAREGGLQF